MDPLLDPLKLHVDLSTALRSLPSTAEAIADMLAGYGVRGVVTGQACPLALYLTARLRPAYPAMKLVVGSHVVAVVLDDRSVLQEMPEAACAFVYAFDRRRYPDLAGRS